jgi:hypothetical protein
MHVVTYNKNTERLDRAPQTILLDGVEELLSPLSKHFELTFREKMVPDQWLIAKTVPVSNILEITNPLPTCAPPLKFLKKLS